MSAGLVHLKVENFRSLRSVEIPLRPLNVLVGPNGAGKTNVLEVFRFLADVVRTDLEPAFASRGGFDEVVFRGGAKPPNFIRVTLQAAWTRYSSENALDEYELRVESRQGRSLSRNESFQFKRTQGRGRRITMSGSKVNVVGTTSNSAIDSERSFGIQRLGSGLSTLPRLSDDEGGQR